MNFLKSLRHRPALVGYLILAAGITVALVQIGRDRTESDRLTRRVAVEQERTAALTKRLLAGTPFNPLGQYPPQSAIDATGAPITSARVGSVVIVEATKCNTANVPVPIAGIVRWQLVSPPGTPPAQVAITGTGVRSPGCTQWTDGTPGVGVTTTHAAYRNAMPQWVTDYVHAQARLHIKTVWTISGEDTPIDPDCTPAVAVPTQTVVAYTLHNGVCQVGAPRIFSTQPFTITP